MRFAPVMAAVLFPAAWLGLRSAPAQPANAVTAACPVSLAVGRHADGATMAITRDSATAATPPVRQWLDLSLTNAGHAALASAELDIHGTENKSRIVTADAAGPAALRRDGSGADAVRHVHLASRVAAAGSWHRLLSVEGLTSVAWVDVVELRYADGSEWHPQTGQVCRVQPPPLMLVAGR